MKAGGRSCIYTCCQVVLKRIYSGAKNKSDANQKSQIFQKSLLVQKQTIYHWKAL